MKNIIGSIYGDIHIRIHPCTVCELEDEEADTVLCAVEDISDSISEDELKSLAETVVYTILDFLKNNDAEWMKGGSDERI
jgi:hypothetical protein